MSRLFLQCGLCGRKQADGLLSRNSWGHLESHDPPLRACPTCRSTHSDWAERLVAVQSNGRATGIYGTSYSSDAQRAVG